jgi:DNA-binding PadR family transcriptional regulator
MRTSGDIEEPGAGAGLVGMGRFSEPAVLILVSLASGQKHGYLINQDIEQFSGSRLGPGTLYGAIARLEARDLIEAVPSTGRKQPYRITSHGLAVLDLELGALGRTVAVGVERLGAV